MTSGPGIAVVVPARNATATLRTCLAAIRTQLAPGDQLVVVDDGSTDATAALAEAEGARVVRLLRTVGPAGARNRGADETGAEILFFVDADVRVASDTLERVRARFGDADLGAVIGSYDESPTDPSLVARYKNLAHHFVHQRSSERAHTFFGACGAIRRAAFLAVGGFDAARYPRPSIEDIELGGRLVRSGISIALDRTLQVTHLKGWRFWPLLRTDLLDRAIPWTRLALERDGFRDDLNLRRRERVVAAGAVVFLAALVASLFSAEILPLAVALGLLQVAANRKFLGFLRTRGGWRLALAGFALHELYYAIAVAGFTIGTLAHVLAVTRPKPAFVRASDPVAVPPATDGNV
jgi:GT2 family glycosyltransferase